MARRSAQELRDWEEFDLLGRPFVRAKVPRGDNVGREYTVAKRLGERYEVKAFFASGGCGLLLSGRDLHTETDVLIKTTLFYDVVHHAKARDKEGFSKQLQRPRDQLQTERRIMVLLKNQGCNGIPNPNDFVFDLNPALAEAFPGDGGKPWKFDDDALIGSEPYLIMERIDGRPLTKVIGSGLSEERVLPVMLQVAHVLRHLHRPFRRSNHSWQIVYQDLKPDNIMVGAGDYTSLIDLGGCRLLVDGKVAMQGAFTNGYCPPECGTVEGLTAAADTYGFGATIYHALTGQSPTDLLGSLGPTSAGPKYVARDRWDWGALKRRVSAPVFQFVQGCLADRPGDRPSNGESLYVDVKRLMRQP